MLNTRSRKFLSFYKPYIGLLLADLACAFVLSAVAVLLPLCTYIITKNILGGGEADMLNRIYLMGGVMLGLVVIHALCNSFVDYRGHMMGAKIESDMRAELFEHYQKLSFSYYDNQRTGQLMSRLTNDLFSLSEFCHHGPEDIAIALLKLIGTLIILVYLNGTLTIALLLFLPLMVAHAFYFNRRMNAALQISRERIGDINAQVEDTLSGIRVVKSFTNEAIESQKFAYENQRFVASRSDGYRSEMYYDTGMIAFTQLMTIGVIIFGGVGIARGSLDLADLLTYLMCVGILVEPIQRLVNFARLYQEGITGFNRLMEILEVEPEIQDAPNALELGQWSKIPSEQLGLSPLFGGEPYQDRGLGHVEGHICFKGVSFKYHEDFDYVLKNISLDIQVGEYVALVGTSGVGKTTLCSLIPRFYEVTDGAILLDGMDIRQVSLRSLRRNIGVVQQDVYLFAGTIADNIRYGKPDASMDEIIAAAQMANAHDFITALPNGYATDIGQRGIKLSGGQKQRLSIARVFLKNPPILIFDEATSALDNESERAVRESLEKLVSNRTTLVIAHRLSTVQNAQRIIVLTDTGIEEQGTHEELMARGGVYASLYNVQLSM